MKHNFLTNPDVVFDCGFNLDVDIVLRAVCDTNNHLAAIPEILWTRIDLKSIGTIVGAFLAHSIATRASAIVNPIEKGHPDVIPASARNATEPQLRNYPVGLEIKGTCGNVAKNSGLHAGDNRCESLTALTWQAHHREVAQLLATVWDFDKWGDASWTSPLITAAFYSSDLTMDDWGAISGTTGRNTKVSGMTSSGKRKMAEGCVFILNDPKYRNRYRSLFCRIPTTSMIAREVLADKLP